MYERQQKVYCGKGPPPADLELAAASSRKRRKLVAAVQETSKGLAKAVIEVDGYDQQRRKILESKIAQREN